MSDDAQPTPMTLGQAWAALFAGHRAKRIAAHQKVDELPCDEALREAAHKMVDEAFSSVEAEWLRDLPMLPLDTAPAPSWELLALLDADGRDIAGVTISTVCGQVTVHGVPPGAAIAAMRVRERGTERVVPLEDGRPQPLEH